MARMYRWSMFYLRCDLNSNGRAVGIVQQPQGQRVVPRWRGQPGLRRAIRKIKYDGLALGRLDG